MLSASNYIIDLIRSRRISHVFILSLIVIISIFLSPCSYVMPGVASASLSWGATGGDSDGRMGAQKVLFAPINLVWRPFQKKDIVLSVEGVASLCQLIHCVLRSQEEDSFQVKAFKLILY